MEGEIDPSRNLHDSLEEIKRPRKQGDKDHEQEVFDSGIYSEQEPGHSNGLDLENLSGSSFPNLPRLALSPTSVPVLSKGSLTSLRTNSYQGGVNSEEIFYSPNVTIGEEESPLACSTPIHNNSKSTVPVTSQLYLQSLLQNFNSLYRKKLADAESTALNGANGANHLDIKNSIMEEWVRDLNEQNKVLIETVDEMEREAEQKIKLLQTKVQRSAQMLMEHMSIIQEYERQVQGFINHREEIEMHLQAFYDEADELLMKKQVLEEKLEVVENEHSSLVKLITRIRDWGVWDINGLEFDPKTYKQLFDLYPRLPGSEVQTVFTQERAREVRENERKLEELEVEFGKLREEQIDTEHLVLDKEKLISDLQKERNELNTKICSLEAENQDYRRRLEETQGLLTKTILMASQSIPNSGDTELNQLVHELKDLKDELHTARTERQTAMSEATALKVEMSQRLIELTQMKELLSKLHGETEVTKGKVQEIVEKQDKLTNLQEQTIVYQEKYDEAIRLLSNKSTTIELLQEQMDILFEKMSQMDVDIGQWVLNRCGKSLTTHNNQISSINGEATTSSSCEVNYNNNVKNPNSSSPPPQPDILMSMQELQTRLRRLEAESAEKDSLVKGLADELAKIKLMKTEIETRMSSRDTEITMQKQMNKKTEKKSQNREADVMKMEHDCLRENWKQEEKIGRIQDWIDPEVIKAEKRLELRKSQTQPDFLAIQTELMEKNVLIYQSHQLLSRIEKDYSPFASSSGVSRNSLTHAPDYHKSENYLGSGIATAHNCLDEDEDPFLNPNDAGSSTQESKNCTSLTDTLLHEFKNSRNTTLPLSAPAEFENVPNNSSHLIASNFDENSYVPRKSNQEMKSFVSHAKKNRPNKNHAKYQFQMLHDLQLQLVKLQAKNQALNERFNEAMNTIGILGKDVRIAQSQLSFERSQGMVLLHETMETFRVMKRQKNFYERKLKKLISSRNRADTSSPSQFYSPVGQKCISKYTMTSKSKNTHNRRRGAADSESHISALQNILSHQQQQIRHYEEYVKRLHLEIGHWPGSPTMPFSNVIDSFASDSVIGTLREKIERDIHAFQTKGTMTTTKSRI